MVRVKICGICDLEAARTAVEAGADLIGFHFCGSDRSVSPDEAKAIIDELSVRPKLVSNARTSGSSMSRSSSRSIFTAR